MEKGNKMKSYVYDKTSDAIDGNILKVYIYTSPRWVDEAGDIAPTRDVEDLLAAASTAGDHPVVLACQQHLGLAVQ